MFLICSVHRFVVSGFVMSGVVRDWRVGLMEAHPRLFPIPRGTSGAEAFPECGEGWRDLLERACVRIESALTDGDLFTAEQIKSKYATLRFYWGGCLSEPARLAVEEAIDLAEARSACTCEVCGAPGRLYDRGGWLETACAEHARGQPVPVRPGCENIHIVRGAVEGGVRIVACRRNDREADAFVDVDPRSLGIEEE
jgi:hypothetical protein